MKLFLTTLFAAISGATATATANAHADLDLTSADIPASSKLGAKILSKARRLENNDGDYTWISGYSIKFVSCVSSTDYYGGYFGGDQGYQNNQYNYYQNQGQNENQNRAYYNGMYQQKLVHFKLCPTGSCRRCQNGADYVVDLDSFIDVAVEAKMEAQQYNCERVRENCYCENARNADACLYSCFQNAKLDYCSNEDNGFSLDEAIECAELEVDEQAMNNYYYKNRNVNGVYQYGEGKYYVGPSCSANGKSINLAVFMEETCSYLAPKGTYEALNYGQKLPFSSKSLIDHDCISCREPSENQYQNYYDQQDEDDVLEMCETLYEEAGKCEENLNIYVYRDNTGCGFIKSLQTSYMPVAVPAKVFAGIFAATTLILGGVAVSFMNRSRRANVSLAGSGGEIA